jgi:hypothetical protein
MIESSLDDLGIVIFRCTGSITLDDIVVAANAAYSALMDDPPTRALWDVQEARFECSLNDMNSGHYRNWAGNATSQRLGKNAVFIIEFLLVRLYSAFITVSEMSMRKHKDKE